MIVVEEPFADLVLSLWSINDTTEWRKFKYVVVVYQFGRLSACVQLCCEHNKDEQINKTGASSYSTLNHIFSNGKLEWNSRE